MNERGFVKNVVIVIALLIVVFLSQQPYFREYGKNLYSQIKSLVEAHWTKTSDWFKNNIYSRVSGEVEQKRTIIQQEINKQKNNIAQNIWEKIKNYFAVKFSKIFGTEVK